MRTPRSRLAISVATVLLLLAGPATASSQSTLTLDALSFISFGDEQLLLLPSGSTIEFQFSPANPDGSIPFVINPSGLSIPAIVVPGRESNLEYSLAAAATGVLSPTSDGHIIQFTGTVAASFDGSPAHLYNMPFTTEEVAATDVAGDHELAVEGLRLVDGVWYTQIVGATTNHTNAFPKPGVAVYTILSGEFDQLPIPAN